jgi:hypothetical protein
MAECNLLRGKSQALAMEAAKHGAADRTPRTIDHSGFRADGF